MQMPASWDSARDGMWSLRVLAEGRCTPACSCELICTRDWQDSRKVPVSKVIPPASCQMSQLETAASAAPSCPELMGTPKCALGSHSDARRVDLGLGTSQNPSHLLPGPPTLQFTCPDKQRCEVCGGGSTQNS